jgi:hypothetical protein
MAGWFPLFAPSGFNGGRSQVNLNFLQTGGDYPFLNAMKTAQSWGFADNTGAPVTPDLLDANGYPTSIVHTGVKTVFFVPTQAARPGNYVITWTGNGTISCGMANTLVSGSKIGSAGSGRYVFSTTDNRFDVGITALPVSNLQVFHANDETALNAGQVFGAKFKQRLAEANFGVVRFLNWNNCNTSNVTTWSTRKPTGYVFYTGYELRAALYAGTTTNSGNAYSTTFPAGLIHSSTGAAWTSGGPLDKDTIHILFNASATQSGTCSLSVGGSGAINILSEYASALSVGGNSYPIAGTFQSLATLVYDADLNAWIKQGGDVAIGNAGIDNGVPPELMVQLCKEIGAHTDMPMPAFALTPMTDYVPQLATYIKNNGPSWMIPRFEGPNELWNTATYITNYANAKATAYGWGADFHNWYGRAISTIGQAVSTVYGNDRTKYQVLCGVQTGTGDTLGNRNNSNPRLASTLYLAQTPQSPYTASAASGWVTHIRPANYVGPSEYGTNQEMLDAYAYSTGTTSVATTYINTLASGSGAFNLANLAILHANWKAWAQGFGVQKMSGYEGGYSSDYDPNINVLFAKVPSPQSAITAATPGNPTVVTLPTTFVTGNTNSNSTTPAASVGMAHIISGLGGSFGTLMNNPGLEGVTVSGGGSANISGANTLILNQAVFFVADAMPTELTQANLPGASGLYSTPYYVVSIGNPFQISATRGGSPIVFNSTGSNVRAQECWFVSAVSGTSVTYDVNSTGTSFTTGGTALYANASLMLNNLRFAAKNVASLSTLTTTNYTNFTGLTGGGFIAEFPSCFQLSGQAPSNNVWSVLEDVYQSPNPPQWNAIVAFNH